MIARPYRYGPRSRKGKSRGVAEEFCDFLDAACALGSRVDRGCGQSATQQELDAAEWHLMHGPRWAKGVRSHLASDARSTCSSGRLSSSARRRSLDGRHGCRAGGAKSLPVRSPMHLSFAVVVASNEDGRAYGHTAHRSRGDDRPWERERPSITSSGKTTVRHLLPLPGTVSPHSYTFESRRSATRSEFVPTGASSPLPVASCQQHGRAPRDFVH